MKLLNLLKVNLFLLLIIFLAVFLRSVLIDKVPNSVDHTELQYIITAKSFLLTGKDVFNQVSPLDLLLFKHPTNVPMQAELPYLLDMPMLAFTNFSLTGVAIPYVAISVLTILLIYLITLKLFDKNTALIAALVATINPWLMFLGRISYDMGPATLFFLCVFYVLLVTKGWKIMLAFPFALLGFYSYLGTKFIFLPLMFLITFYVYWYINKKKYLKQYLLLMALSVFLTIFFLLQINHEGSRISEIITPNSPLITEQVDLARKTTLQNPLMSVFENKISFYSVFLIKNATNIFSPTYLFVNADYFLLNGDHGLFYYADAIFLVLGLFWTMANRRKLSIFLIAFMAISIMPQLAHNPYGYGNFTPHVSLLIPILIVFVAVGINRAMTFIKNKKYLYLFSALLSAVYLSLFLNYANDYFFRFPLQQGVFDVQDRILSRYLSISNNENVRTTVYSIDPANAFLEYLFYTDTYNKNTANTINKSIAEKKYSFKNISIVNCDRSELTDLQSSVVLDDTSCKRQPNIKSISIAQPKDSGSRYRIYNDKICSGFDLRPYISNLTLTDFDIEKLSVRKFCETFIVSYR